MVNFYDRTLTGAAIGMVGKLKSYGIVIIAVGHISTTRNFIPAKSKELKVCRTQNAAITASNWRGPSGM
jgi:hypothetical protein